MPTNPYNAYILKHTLIYEEVFVCERTLEARLRMLFGDAVAVQPSRKYKDKIFYDVTMPDPCDHLPHTVVGTIEERRLVTLERYPNLKDWMDKPVSASIPQARRVAYECYDETAKRIPDDVARRKDWSVRLVGAPDGEHPRSVHDMFSSAAEYALRMCNGYPNLWFRVENFRTWSVACRSNHTVVAWLRPLFRENGDASDSDQVTSEDLLAAINPDNDDDDDEADY